MCPYSSIHLLHSCLLHIYYVLGIIPDARNIDINLLLGSFNKNRNNWYDYNNWHLTVYYLY